MKEIVWVFGTSASGKETFIRNVANDQSVVKSLGWTDRTISPNTSSLKNVAQFDDDPIVNFRQDIINETQQLFEVSDIILIKWQIVDSERSLLQQLKQLVPEARHRIIRLEVPMSELVVRLKTKPWWHDNGEEGQFIEAELKTIAKSINELHDDFELTTIDASAKGGYRIVTSN